jgi:hypothetical protein
MAEQVHLLLSEAQPSRLADDKIVEAGCIAIRRELAS